MISIIKIIAVPGAKVGRARFFHTHVGGLQELSATIFYRRSLEQLPLGKERHIRLTSELTGNRSNFRRIIANERYLHRKIGLGKQRTHATTQVFAEGSVGKNKDLDNRSRHGQPLWGEGRRSSISSVSKTVLVEHRATLSPPKNSLSGKLPLVIFIVAIADTHHLGLPLQRNRAGAEALIKILRNVVSKHSFSFLGTPKRQLRLGGNSALRVQQHFAKFEISLLP